MDATIFTNLQLCSILESGETANPFDEIATLLQDINSEADLSLLRKIHDDINLIFSGRYPGFVTGAVKYHDLRHTYNVVLAAARLFHGLFHEKTELSNTLLFQGLISAYFHDTGMLPQAADNHTHNSNYSKNHEERSIGVLQNYLRSERLAEYSVEKCSLMIKYTNLEWNPDGDIDDELKLYAQVVGSADLLAQMADRYYLESLPLLFHEHQDGGIDKHSSAIDLMSSTIDFHENVIKKRLKQTLGNLAPAMQTHFQKRWGINQNVYLDNIELNINYLKKITHDCSMDLSCWGKFLRRNPPTADL